MSIHHSLIVSTLLAVTAGTASAQIVLMPDTSSDSVVSFSPIDGSVLATNLFSVPSTETLISAIDVNGEVWISSQTGDTVYRYDFAGTQLGQIGPTFSGAGFDNIRGIAYVNGIVYVTNAGTSNGAPGDAVIAFDPTGTYLFHWSTAGLVDSPFAVTGYQGDLLVCGSGNNDDVYRFDAVGNPIGSVHDSATLAFAHQVQPSLDGFAWVSGFSSDNVVKIDVATGQVLSELPTNNTRGVFELLNGNILWTDSNGVHVYDRIAGSSTMVHAGGGRHLNLYGGTTTGQASTVYYGQGCGGLQTGADERPTLGNANFTLTAYGVTAASPVALFAFGSAQSEPGISLDGLGMVGCSAYHNLDLGVFGGGAVVSGTSSVALPVPNNPALIGGSTAVQSLAFSNATALGLASGNGLLLTFGN